MEIQNFSLVFKSQNLTSSWLHNENMTKMPVLYLSSLRIVFEYSFIFFLFRAAPMAYGSSQARVPIRNVAAGLHHSHSNVRSKSHLRPTVQLVVTLKILEYSLRSSLVARWDKDPALSLLRHGLLQWWEFNLWSKNFCMPWVWQKKKKKKGIFFKAGSTWVKGNCAWDLVSVRIAQVQPYLRSHTHCRRRECWAWWHIFLSWILGVQIIQAKGLLFREKVPSYMGLREGLFIYSSQGGIPGQEEWRTRGWGREGALLNWLDTSRTQLVAWLQGAGSRQAPHKHHSKLSIRGNGEAVYRLALF